MWKNGLIGIALGAMVFGAAAEARAQTQVVRVADVASVGGFVAFNDKVTFWAQMHGARITGGLVQVERQTRQASAPLVMTGQIAAADMYQLWTDLYDAKPWRTPKAHALGVNTDFPDTVVTYLGQYREEIDASFISPAAIPHGMPAVSGAMTTFLAEAWGYVAQVAAQPFMVYDASGSRSGYHRTITIAQDGTITDDLSYAAPGWPAPTSKQGTIAADKMNALAALCSTYAHFPAKFPGDPRIVDGIGITTTLTRFGISKAVFAGAAGSRPAGYQAILDDVAALAASIP